MLTHPARLVKPVYGQIEVLTNQVRKILAVPHVGDATSGLLAAAEHLKDTMATSVNTEGY